MREPKAFLFDEPLSNLDAALRVNMRLEITELHQQLKTTMVYVTHDQVEAMTMADKIVVLNAGNIEQFGTPMELYKTPDQPVRRRLHRLAEDELHRGRAGGQVRRQDHRRPPRASARSRHPRANGRATVGVAEHLGSDTFLHVHVDGAGLLTVRTDGESPFTTATRLADARPGQLHRFDGDGKAIAA